MKPLTIIALAVLINVLIFLLIPLLQVLLSDPPVKDKYKNKLETDLEVVLQKRTHEEVKKEIKPIRTFNRKFRPSSPMVRNVKMNLDVSTEGEGVAVESGGFENIVYLPGETDTDARVKGNPRDPEMPLRAEREEVGGRVTALWVVNESGRTVHIDIISEDPKGFGFGKSVRNYLKNLRWEPATIKKVPVRQKITQDFNFNE